MLDTYNETKVYPSVVQLQLLEKMVVKCFPRRIRLILLEEKGQMNGSAASEDTCGSLSDCYSHLTEVLLF